MKHLRRLGVALCVFSGSTGLLLACGDDDSVLLATGDGGIDGSTNRDSSSDSNTASDSNVPTDSSVLDTSAPDAKPDGPVDAQADVEIPPVDAGSPDADASDLAAEFPSRLAAEICQTTARCCFGDANTQADASVDGGRYDMQKCLNLYKAGGLDQSNPAAQGAVDPSKITYNASKASECLGRVKALSCGANAAEYHAMIIACYNTLPGTAGAGVACTQSAECQPGFFCNTSTSQCEAIRNTGAACGDWTTNATISQNTCSNRYSAEPPRFCRILDDAGSLPAAQWKCNDGVGLGQRCINDAWCNGGVCVKNAGPGSACQDFITLFTQQACGSFVTQ